jgi:hypothetical protein
MRSRFNLGKQEVSRKELADLLGSKHGVDRKTTLSLMRLYEEDQELDEETPKEQCDLVEEFHQIVEFTDGETDKLELELVSSSGSEESILAAAVNSRLDNAYSKLSQRFDFGEFMTQFEPREGTIPEPEDYAAAIGLGVDMSSKGMWLAGDGISALLRMGHENVVHQIAASLKMSYSAVSNWHRTAQRIPAHQRHEISPTVALEIATAKFSDDEEENSGKIRELLDKARKEGWSGSEARSHVRMEKGKEPLQKLEKPASAWLKEFGGAEALLVAAVKGIMVEPSMAAHHFAVSLAKAYPKLTEEAKEEIRGFLIQMKEEEVLNEDTEDVLRKIFR